MSSRPNYLNNILLVLTSAALVGGFGYYSGRSAKREAAVVAFHESYGDVWNDRTFWFGISVLKNPMDMWVYQEILHEVRPDLLIETGTHEGGSALFFASMLDLLGDPGQIVTIDINEAPARPRHERIIYLKGSSTSEEIVDRVRQMAKQANTVMVVLDSDHSRDHVLAELRKYAPLVTVGSYLVVEDTCINGHPLLPDFGPGPYEALQEFLAENSDFEVDESRHKFQFTSNPDGYVRRIR